MPDLNTLLGAYVREHTPRSAPPFETVRARLRRQPHRRTALAAFAALAVVAGTAGLVTQIADGDRGPAAGSSLPPDPASNIPPSPTGALPDDGLTSCAFEYGPDTLGRQAFAFDGTVIDIVHQDRGGFPTDVTFRVEQRYRGGNPAEITLSMSSPTRAPNAHPWMDYYEWPLAPSFGIGSRLLVSGNPRHGGYALDDPVVWGCGFTRYHDEATAAEWALAFG